MNDVSFLGLIQNISLLLTVAFIFDIVAVRWHEAQTFFWQVVVGLVLGAIGITLMLTPFKFSPGIIFDTRSVLIAISGLFFGPVSAVIVMVIAGTVRLHIGGTGVWTGVAVILASGIIGIVWKRFRRRSLNDVSWRELYLFGMVIHLVMLAMFFLMPWETALQVLSNIGLPVLVVYPMGTALLGTLMVNRLRRERAKEELRQTNTFLDSIIENIPHMIFLKDAKELRFVRFNQAGEYLLGNSREDMLGKNDYDFFPKEQADFFTQKDREVLLRKEVVDIPEEPILTRNKGKRTVHTRKVPILNARKEPEYLLGISEDITSRKHAEEELRHTMEKLRQSLVGTVQALSSTVERRDPYTAGHQRKVSSLARTIAQEMGLSNDTIDAIRTAGIIHDIGKISVPAEILSKPGKLGEAEFSLIKLHPQIGYDILKDTALPYPIAEIILQHHERLDGSGYPQGLKDGQILLESQIIGVADVVEAMASHRPYRPALGIEVALEEIEKNKGVLYGEKVVDACLKLFRDKGFKFETIAL